MATVEDLGKLIKAKHPEYADMDNAALGLKVQSKFPGAYDDFTPVAAASPEPFSDIPFFNRAHAAMEGVRQGKPMDVLGNLGAAGYSIIDPELKSLGIMGLGEGLAAAPWRTIGGVGAGLATGTGVEKAGEAMGLPGWAVHPVATAAGALAGGAVSPEVAGMMKGGMRGLVKNWLAPIEEQAAPPPFRAEPTNPGISVGFNGEPVPITPPVRGKPIPRSIADIPDPNAKPPKVPPSYGPSTGGAQSYAPTPPPPPPAPPGRAPGGARVAPIQPIASSTRPDVMVNPVDTGSGAPLTPMAGNPSPGPGTLQGQFMIPPVEPSPVTPLKPIDKFEMNRMAHARAQELPLPGSPAGKNGHANLSAMAKKKFGVNSWSDLSVDQMRQVYDELK